MAGKNLNRYRKDGNDMAIYTINGHSLERGGYRMGAAPNPVIVLKFRKSDYSPTDDSLRTFGEWVLMDASTNTWGLEPINKTNWMDLFKGKFTSGYDRGLVDLVSMDCSGVSRIDGIFDGCTQLKSIDGITNIDTATSLSRSFRNCNLQDGIGLFELGPVTSMQYAFSGTSTPSIPLLDTGGVKDFMGAFSGMSAVTEIPALDIHSAEQVSTMFANCVRVQAGILSMYGRLSSLPGDVGRYSWAHLGCFQNCGSMTTTGSAELSQVPSEWK